MKRLFALALNCLFLQTGIAQKTEFSIGVGGTGSFFRGADAASESAIYLSDVPGAIPNRTANYYGKKPGIGLSVEATVQHLGKRKFLTGLSVGYESVTSRVKITEVSSRLISPADGTTKLTHTFINCFPYIGKRFGSLTSNSTTMLFDVNLGFDIAIPLSAYEKGEAKVSGGNTVTTDYAHRKVLDVRPRLQLKLQKNKIGVQSSYSIGQTEYFGKTNGGDPEAYSNVFRLGIFYVL